MQITSRQSFSHSYAEYYITEPGWANARNRAAAAGAGGGYWLWFVVCENGFGREFSLPEIFNFRVVEVSELVENERVGPVLYTYE